MAVESKRWRVLLAAGIAAALVVGVLALPAGQNMLGRFLRSLRVQKVQAVNVDLSAFTDPNANPTLHQMVAQMISDKVVVTVNEKDQPASDAAAASQLAGFHTQLLSARKDAPKLVVTGEHAMNLSVDRARLQAIFSESGHPDLALPQSLDGAAVAVRIPRAVEAQWGTCPGPANATDEIASNITGPPASSTEYSDCVRLRQGTSPMVNVPAGLDIAQSGGDWARGRGDESKTSSRFPRDGRLAIDPGHVRAAFPAVLPGSQGEWGARHAPHPGGQARTGLHVDLGQEWNGLFAGGLWRFQPGCGIGGLAQVIPEHEEEDPWLSRIALPFKRKACARSSETRSRCATSRSPCAAARSSVSSDRMARARARRSRCYWDWSSRPAARPLSWACLPAMWTCGGESASFRKISVSTNG